MLPNFLRGNKACRLSKNSGSKESRLGGMVNEGVEQLSREAFPLLGEKCEFLPVLSSRFHGRADTGVKAVDLESEEKIAAIPDIVISPLSTPTLYSQSPFYSAHKLNRTP